MPPAAAPIRVLLFTDADVFAGTERHIIELAIALRTEGAEVRVACPVPAPLAARAAAGGVGIVPIAKRRMFDWPAVRTIKSLLAARELDVVHAHNGRTSMLAAAAVRLAGRGHCVTTQHFLQPSRVGRRGVKRLASAAVHRWVDRHTDHVIAISEAVREASIARGEVDPERVSVVYNGVSPPDVNTLSPPESVREELRIDASAPLVVCVARLQREKGVASLVGAMKIVANHMPEAVCAVAGDGEEEHHLRRAIDAGSLQRSVRLLGFRSDALALMRAADVVVLPSLAEGFGLVLPEAMSLGKPVVATRAGGPAEIVIDGDTGLLVPPSDPIQLAAALLKLLGDAGLRAQMGAEGRERFLNQFTAARMAQATLEVYESVLARGREATSKVVRRQVDHEPAGSQ